MDAFDNDRLVARWSSVDETPTARDQVAGEASSLDATILGLSDDRAERAAGEIVGLHEEHLANLLKRAERGVVVCSACKVRVNGGGCSRIRAPATTSSRPGSASCCGRR